MNTRFSGLKLGLPIEVFALNKAFTEDTYEKKVNLSIGGMLHAFYLIFNLVINRHKYNKFSLII